MQRVERERHLDDVEARVALIEAAALHAHSAHMEHAWGPHGAMDMCNGARAQGLDARRS